MDIQAKIKLNDLGFADWRDVFAADLRASGRSERTVQAYLQDVRSFAAWFERSRSIQFSPEQITGVDLREHRAWAVEGRNLKPSSWNRRRVALATLCRWAQEVGYLEYDPFQGVEAWEEEETPPRWLCPGDFSKFLRQVEINVNGAMTEHWRWQALRDRAMIMLMAGAGMREGEVVALRLEDVVLGERSGRAIIWRGKGDKKREVPLGAEVRRALVDWLAVRAGSGGDCVFVGKGRADSAISTRLVQRRVAEIGRQAGMAVTPHDLRHSFAKRALDRGAPLSVVSKLLGHRRVDTTARYVKPGWDDLQSAVERI